MSQKLQNTTARLAAARSLRKLLENCKVHGRGTRELRERTSEKLAAKRSTQKPNTHRNSSKVNNFQAPLPLSTDSRCAGCLYQYRATGTNIARSLPKLTDIGVQSQARRRKTHFARNGLGCWHNNHTRQAWSINSLSPTSDQARSKQNGALSEPDRLERKPARRSRLSSVTQLRQRCG